MSDAPRFDEIVHAPNRLQICAILSAVDSADFAAVREGLGVADSVLSKHIRVLHEAGYIEVRKATCASRVRTSLALTEAGRAASTGTSPPCSQSSATAASAAARAAGASPRSRSSHAAVAFWRAMTSPASGRTRRWGSSDCDGPRLRTLTKNKR